MTSTPSINTFSTLPGATPPPPAPKTGGGSDTKDAPPPTSNDTSRSPGVNVLA